MSFSSFFKSALDPVHLAQGLLRCPSVTPKEGGALNFLTGHLQKLGFSVERPVFCEEGLEPVDNLFAHIGEGTPHLAFAGHTDVVPPGAEESWTHPPFEGFLEKDVLFGRGAVDMKGGIAAFLAAASAFVPLLLKRPQRGQLSFLITGDEEGTAQNGTRKLLPYCTEKGYVFNACLLGEPTNPSELGEMIKIGRRGSLSLRLEVRGRQGHVAYPHQAKNPIPLLLRCVQSFIEMPLDAGMPPFEASHLEVTSLDVGNTASNVIPEKASACFNIRFNSLWTQSSLTEKLLQRLAEVHPPAASPEEKEALQATLMVLPGGSDAFLAEDPKLLTPLLKAITTHTGKVPVLSTSGGTSDARFIRHFCPVVEFGLVNATLHQIDERVPLEDLFALRDIYFSFLLSYFGLEP